jgi:serine/threonine-protein kinase
MPPEQMEGKELTPAADVFAVAVLLMELWSGRAPFRKRTREEIEAAMRAVHPKPSDVDIRLLPLDDVMKSAMALDPKARPQQADDLSRALRKFLTGVDLHDVARKLGDRVKGVRENPPPASTEKKAILQRPPSRPTATQVGTKTFAARSEVNAWKETEEAGTRRIASSKPPPSKDVETVATRPIETDPRAEKVSAAAPARRGLLVGSLVGVAAVAVAAFFLGKGAGTTETPPVATTTTATASISTTATPTTTTTAAHSATPTATPTATSTATPSGASAVERATLTMLGDGTFIAVDGVTRGPSPLKLTVEPGPHSVVFTFPATGESKGTSLTVKSGEKATLRADFTGATPTIRLQR